MSTTKYVIGLDFGTDSARAVIANAHNGEEVASSVKYYPRWMEGKYCNPAKDQYRQHPLDYLEVTEFVVREALQKAGKAVAEGVVGISFDTTGSTPVLVNSEGIPLSLTPGFEENPNAMFVLWKDHTAIREAAEINQLAHSGPLDYTKYEGGIYSSEWVWAKIAHLLREDDKVKNAAYSWVEHCDWMPAVLTGNTRPEEVKRSRCAAGHKAMWHDSWDGLPSEEFLVAFEPALKGYRSRLYTETYTGDAKVGNLTPEWAAKFGLSTGVSVGAGAFDCHVGAVGGEIRPNVLVRSIGTSTCDIITVPYEQFGNKFVAGICGQVDGSVVPGYIGLEAGQSAFGDIYAWFRRLVAWPLENILSRTALVDPETRAKLIAEAMDRIIPELSAEAAKIPVTESTILATDWLNGRRTPDANQEVTGTITGLKLGSTAPALFRALVEATAYGSKAIADRFEREGILVEEVIGLGGVAKKSPFVMQTLADVLNVPIKVAKTEQTCAFGACMFAAVVSGVYRNVEEAQQAMGQGFETEYRPIAENVAQYAAIYEKYLKLGYFTDKEL